MLFYGYRKSYRAKGAAVKGGYQFNLEETDKW